MSFLISSIAYLLINLLSLEEVIKTQFIASITDSEQELAKTEKALAYAEKQPSQKNYDEAATSVTSLTAYT